MRDIPVFSTDNGAATLILSKVPYTKEAYIELRGCSCFDAFIDECRSFCEMAGVTRIYAAGEEALRRYALHCSVVEMRCEKGLLPKVGAVLQPVEEATLDAWRSVYNEKMCHVPAAACLSLSDGKKLLSQGKAYYVFEHDRIIGIGVASGNTVEAIASVCPGKGGDVLSALTAALDGPTVSLQVSTNNHKAIGLYTHLGFKKTGVAKDWYQIL